MKLVTIIRHIIIWQFGTPGPGPGPDHTNVIIGEISTPDWVILVRATTRIRKFIISIIQQSIIAIVFPI